MMNSFLEFIEKDIAAKKTLISTMPTRTKTNIKKFNENIDNTMSKNDRNMSKMYRMVFNIDNLYYYLVLSKLNEYHQNVSRLTYFPSLTL